MLLVLFIYFLAEEQFGVTLLLTIEADNISTETMDGPNLSTYTAQTDPQRATCKTMTLPIFVKSI